MKDRLIWMIISPILFVWCIINRASKKGNIIGEPFGMPRGTIRALITITIVSFPYGYILQGVEIPSLVINAIFILVAFYFQSRKTGQEFYMRVIKGMKEPKKLKEERRRQIMPLYLPKYSVRTILIVMLITILIINNLRLDPLPFQTSDTWIDILLIIVLYIIGGIFLAFIKIGEKRKLQSQIKEIDGYQSKSNWILLGILMEKKPELLKMVGRNIISILILFTVFASLILYTINLDFSVLILPFYEFSLRETLLLLTNLYYGIRDN